MSDRAQVLAWNLPLDQSRLVVTCRMEAELVILSVAGQIPGVRTPWILKHQNYNPIKYRNCIIPVYLTPAYI